MSDPSILVIDSSSWVSATKLSQGLTTSPRELNWAVELFEEWDISCDQVRDWIIQPVRETASLWDRYLDQLESGWTEWISGCFGSIKQQLDHEAGVLSRESAMDIAWSGKTPYGSLPECSVLDHARTVILDAVFDDSCLAAIQQHSDMVECVSEARKFVNEIVSIQNTVRSSRDDNLKQAWLEACRQRLAVSNVRITAKVVGHQRFLFTRWQQDPARTYKGARDSEIPLQLAA